MRVCAEAGKTQCCREWIRSPATPNPTWSKLSSIVDGSRLQRAARKRTLSVVLTGEGFGSRGPLVSP
jgi:hypothetical protein